jgi:hypothetical protein
VEKVNDASVAKLPMIVATMMVEMKMYLAVQTMVV